MTALDAMTTGLRRLGYENIADLAELQRVVEVQNIIYVFNHKEVVGEKSQTVQIPTDGTEIELRRP